MPGAAGPRSLLFCDCDDFKGYNDDSGTRLATPALYASPGILKRQQPGVLIWRRATVVRSSCSPSSTRMARSPHLAETIRAEIEASARAWRSPLTVSIGIATSPEDATARDELRQGRHGRCMRPSELDVTRCWHSRRQSCAARRGSHGGDASSSALQVQVASPAPRGCRHAGTLRGLTTTAEEPLAFRRSGEARQVKKTCAWLARRLRRGGLLTFAWQTAVTGSVSRLHAIHGAVLPHVVCGAIVPVLAVFLRWKRHTA